MEIKPKLPVLLKRTSVYSQYRGLKLRKSYSNKYGVGLRQAFIETKVVKNDLKHILDNVKLADAQIHPEKHPDLIVRV